MSNFELHIKSFLWIRITYTDNRKPKNREFPDKYKACFFSHQLNSKFSHIQEVDLLDRKGLLTVHSTDPKNKTFYDKPFVLRPSRSTFILPYTKINAWPNVFSHQDCLADEEMSKGILTSIKNMQERHFELLIYQQTFSYVCFISSSLPSPNTFIL